MESAPVVIGKLQTQIKAAYRGIFSSIKPDEQGKKFENRTKLGGGSTRHVQKPEPQYMAELDSSELDSYAKSRVALLPKGFGSCCLSRATAKEVDIAHQLGVE